MKKFTLLTLGIVFLICASISVAAETKGAEKIKVAGVWTTVLEEPFINVNHQAILKAKKEMGVEYDYTEQVTAADFERVLREYAARGFNIIVVDAYGHEEMSRRVAKDFPEVLFLGLSDLGPTEPNFYVSGSFIHEPAYLAGMIAGKLTKTNVLGVVAAYPVPVTNRLINPFIKGAKEVNPKVKVKVRFISSWFDPPKAKEATMALIEAGADIFYAERYGVIEACQKKGILAIGNMEDQNALAPNTVITSPVWYMWPTMKKVITDVRENKIDALDLRQWSMMTKGGAYLAPYHGLEKKIPSKVKSMVAKRAEKIKSGLFVVPIEGSPPQSD
jgi:basic membrane lipoprotein Med (substrate-binding protein (PBP1-ABC) superfamily)